MVRCGRCEVGQDELNGGSRHGVALGNNVYGTRAMCNAKGGLGNGTWEVVGERAGVQGASVVWDVCEVR